MTPARPTHTAAQRRRPTGSRNTSAVSAVISTGAMKKIDVASAMLMEARPRKNALLATTSRMERARMRPARRVRHSRKPPSRRMANNVTATALLARTRMTSCSG